jgi:hypothetical protein
MTRSTMMAIISAICLALLSIPANAQATRTWVSGVGDDANPCSRTAPCKTFAGTIAKTAPAGEINCLDPGGFGALTITKAISIICQAGTAGVLVSGTNGIIVAAGAGDVVYLQGIDFEGLNSGLNGISFTSGLALHVKDCIIRGFITNGINFAPGANAGQLVVQDTVVADNTGGGILIAPSSTFVGSATITNTHMDNNAFGLKVKDNGRATVYNSTAASNINNGYFAGSTTSTAEINVFHSVTSNNGFYGVGANGAGALIRLLDVAIYDNNTGIFTSSSATVTSFSPASNANAGNTVPSSPNGTAIPLQ